MIASVTEHPKSYYAASGLPQAARAPLYGSARADVSVIGAGYTGLNTALSLAKRGLRFIVLEGARVVWGASGRNGGQIVHSYSRDIDVIEARYGRDLAVLLAAMAFEGAAALRDNVRAFEIDCHLRNGAVFAAVNTRQARRLEHHKTLWESIGHPGMEIVTGAATADHVATDRYEALLVDPTGGHFHPLRLAPNPAIIMHSDSHLNELPELTPSRLRSHWMPFSGNRGFHTDPRLLVSAEVCFYRDPTGRQIFHGLSGLWTCGLGHGRPEIAEAVSRQITKLDYAPPFQFGHPLSSELAERLACVMPEGLDRVFFTGSGSESADTSLKMARAYSRLIGRGKGYHGASFGGISVGGIGGNRKFFGEGIAADHLPHTLLAENAFSRGMPPHGVSLADELLELINLHDSSNIAAAIVEPFSGSAGVAVPPHGYLQLLREICDQHDILLILDEVITAFGRAGGWTGRQVFGVKPDILNFAKQVTNGAIPMGWVVVTSEIYDAFMDAGGRWYAFEFPRGFTYSAHPVACAAALATLDVLQQMDCASTGSGACAALRERGAGFRMSRTSATSVSRRGSRWRPFQASGRVGRWRWRCGAGSRASTCDSALTPCSWHRPSSRHLGRWMQ